MKKLILFSCVALLMSSCYIDAPVPRYDVRDRLVGHYEMEEYSETYDDYTYYSVRVSKSSYRDEVFLNNFYGADIRVYAIVNSDHFDIPFQNVDGYEIEGSGYVDGSEIHMNYYVKDTYSGTRRDYCDALGWLE